VNRIFRKHKQKLVLAIAVILILALVAGPIITMVSHLFGA
jgi:hypothetical protein